MFRPSVCALAVLILAVPTFAQKKPTPEQVDEVANLQPEQETNEHAAISPEELEMIAEGALDQQQLAELDAHQAAMDLTEFGSVGAAAPAATPYIELDLPTSEQTRMVRRDTACGRRMDLFAPTDEQVESALHAEHLRMLAAGIQNPEPRFIDVNKSVRTENNPYGQTMQIYVFRNGRVETLWPERINVSTAKEEVLASTQRCATTPAGFFRPYKLYRSYVSGTFAGSQMPNAVFIFGGIALHATPNDAAHQGSLGQRASGGCVRLQGPEYARAIGRPNDSEVDISLRVRLEVMRTGRGIEAGNFGTVNEGGGRVRITNNEIPVQKVERMGNLMARVSAPATAPGAEPVEPVITPIMEQAWGTVVYIHF